MTRLCINISRKFNTCKIEDICGITGYPLEVHRVRTEDGYIITIHRINRLEDRVTFPKNTPILLQHGLWSSSVDWLFPGQQKSIGFLLARAGFDVWLGNTRGNIYSRAHVRLSPEKDSDAFWDFSWHEMGMYDLPSMIDHILKETKKQHMYYIGHSQGTTAFFVMAANKPEYNAKIRAMFAFAPVIFLQHMDNRFLQSLASISDPLKKFLNIAGLNKVLPWDNYVSLFDKFWTKDSNNFQRLANVLIKEVSFFAADEVKRNLKNIILLHMRTGTSLKVLAHFAQCAQKDKPFRHFDYGPDKNFNVYGSSEAPVYNLKNITVPIVAFHSDNDWLTNRRDIERMVEQTKQNIILETINEPHFNHLDFIWADATKFIVLPKLFRYLYVYENYL